MERTQKGKRHNKAAGDEEGYRFPEGSKLWKGLCFQGYEPGRTTTYLPKKKPRGAELTPKVYKSRSASKVTEFEEQLDKN